MIRNPQEMPALTMQLAMSTWTLAAIGAVLESGLVEHLREARSVDDLAARCPTLSRARIERCLAVAATAGVVASEGGQYRLAEGAMCFSQPPMRASLQGDVRSQLMQALAFLDSSAGKGPSAGWSHSDPTLLQAQGDGSAGIAGPFKTMIAPMLGDLPERLGRPGARFLDVGAGVASLSIAMCRGWPALRVVGLDASETPLAAARQNVERAGLADRIELRRLAVEELRDEESFDLAWLPSMFIPAAALPTGAARVRASLRPGGWVLFPIGGFAGEERARAVFALVNELWGGPVLAVAEAESLLKEAGFSTVRALPGPPWAPPLLAAQR